jgi:hypothetical protein
MIDPQRLILVDCDGVCLDWEWAFDAWMEQHGFTMIPGGKFIYDIGDRYNIGREQGKRWIKIFNESAAIGFLPALRDAMHYIKRLHEEHGYCFHMITSLSTDTNAQELRRMNVRKLFGDTAFAGFTFLETGSDKDQAVLPYKDSGCWWIEDKLENCLAGRAVGLRSILMQHEHNLDDQHPEVFRVRHWRDIYALIIDHTNPEFG